MLLNTSDLLPTSARDGIKERSRIQSSLRLAVFATRPNRLTLSLITAPNSSGEPPVGSTITLSNVFTVSG